MTPRALKIWHRHRRRLMWRMAVAEKGKHWRRCSLLYGSYQKIGFLLKG